MLLPTRTLVLPILHTTTIHNTPNNMFKFIPVLALHYRYLTASSKSLDMPMESSRNRKEYKTKLKAENKLHRTAGE
jgi:hypothetical protein